MAGSPHNGGPRDEQGKLIRFPGSKWVSEDGVEPLTGGPRPTEAEPATATVDPSDRDWAAFEPNDFWDSGETQQFVGAAGSSTAAPAPCDDAIDEEHSLLAVPPASGHSSGLLTEASENGGDGDRSARPGPSRNRAVWSRFRMPLPTTTIVAAVGLVALAGTGAFIGLQNARAPSTVARHFAAQRSPVTNPVAARHPRIATGAKPHRTMHRARRSHREKPRTTARNRSSVVASTRSASEPAAPPPAPAQPVYHSSPSGTAASSDSSSSSGGQRAGPSGTVSLVGAGTSPSG